MKLSVRGEYALRALLVLGRDYVEDDSVVSIQAISRLQNIPKRFLEQILNDLKSAGIVASIAMPRLITASPIPPSRPTRK